MKVAYSLIEAQDLFAEIEKGQLGYVTCVVGESQQVCKTFKEAEDFFEMHELRTQGLMPRYTILKADGSPVDPDAEYFVLRLDDGGSDKIHIGACRDAVLLYAMMVQDHLPVLSKELFEKYGPATFPSPAKNFLEDLKRLINKYSLENGSNTPDYILADFLNVCLLGFDKATRNRETWYGVKHSPGEDPEFDGIKKEHRDF